VHFHPTCQDSGCCRCIGVAGLQRGLPQQWRHCVILAFQHLYTGAWFHFIKPLLFVDKLTPLAVTHLEASRSECQ